MLSGKWWIWSDLHLHHKNIMRYCERPFDGVTEMDDALYDAWDSAVGGSDVVICGGDVALAGSLRPERLARVRAQPGEKLLVLGNHDMDRKGRPSATGFDEQMMSMVIDNDPPLLLTHLPLDMVPPGTVNVHGHVHNNVPPGRGRHINICVEHTGYRPLPLGTIRVLAAELATGRVPPGETTIERIEAIGGRESPGA